MAVIAFIIACPPFPSAQNKFPPEKAFGGDTVDIAARRHNLTDNPGYLLLGAYGCLVYPAAGKSHSTIVRFRISHTFAMNGKFPGDMIRPDRKGNRRAHLLPQFL